MLTLRKIENVPTGPNNRPKLVVKITGEHYVVSRRCESDLGASRMWRNVNARRLLDIIYPIPLREQKDTR
jgi:hypothetical protein